MPPKDSAIGAIGRLAFVWGVAGVLAIVAQPLFRLTPIALDAVEGGLSIGQWVALVLWVAISGYAEGYRGFHRRFSPRVIARAQYLARHPRPLWVVFAPFFCTSLFHASRRGRIVARALVLGIALVVIAVRQLDQPWRGIIDAGVVVGLSLGLASLLYHLVRLGLGHAPPVPPDLPEAEA